MSLGYIKLHRQIIEWEWYSDTPTRSVFIDLLLNASHNGYKWHGLDIERGQAIFGRKEASKRLGLSEQSIRSAIKHLKSTSEITIKVTNKFSLITIVNYSKYQDEDCKSTSKVTTQLTNDQPATNQQLTTTKNVNNEKNVNNNSNLLLIPEEENFKTFKGFQSKKEELVLKAKELYPNKNIDKAIEDFIEWCQTSKTSNNTKDYKLRFFKWVREDLYNKYGLYNQNVHGNKTTLGIV